MTHPAAAAGERLSVQFTPSPALFPFESRWFDSSVGPIHYVDEGRGRPILFLHGNPTWSFLYRNIIINLRDRFRCIAVDYPGFGLSVRPSSYGYTPAEHARIVRELVDHLGLDDFIIMGQDWGGPIGLSLAVSDPARVAALVFGNTWFWPLDRAFNKLFSRGMSTRVMQCVILRRNLFVERFIPMGTARRLAPEEMAHYRRAQPFAAARKGVAEFPRQLLAAGPWLSQLERDVTQSLASKPLLLVWGMRDIAFNAPHFLPRWRATFTDQVLVELPNAKHYIQEDAPDEIARAIATRFHPDRCQQKRREE